MTRSSSFSPFELSKGIVQDQAQAWAPANIALVKYWGKRDEALNLPTHGSVSLSLGKLGTNTKLRWNEALKSDTLVLNGREVAPQEAMKIRLSCYLDRFRPSLAGAYEVISDNSVPTAAGLASSASGFAALAKALNHLHGWDLSDRELSILARLGSGSAARSLFEGFALWHAGQEADGSDSFAEGLAWHWEELCWVVVCVSDKSKGISSREAMNGASATCPWFGTWIELSKQWLKDSLQAIEKKDFTQLGEGMEASSLAMHATMIGSRPPTFYWKEKTLECLHEVSHLRRMGIECYFTMDAGPNVKILYQRKDTGRIKDFFNEKKLPLIWIDPWI